MIKASWQPLRRARPWAGSVVLLTAALAQGAAAAQALSDCNDPSFQRVLQPIPAAGVAQSREASAVWIDHERIIWPGASSEGRFSLYRSKGSAIVALGGEAVAGFDERIALSVETAPMSAADVQKTAYLGSGVQLRLPARPRQALANWLREQLVLVQHDREGRVVRATELQHAHALDALYAEAAEQVALGARVSLRPPRPDTRFALWAPTAQSVAVCVYATGESAAAQVVPMRPDVASGVWRAALTGNAAGRYYTYLVDVHVRGVGVVRNRVTDPYSLSLTTDSLRTYIADLDAPNLSPAIWAKAPRPVRVKAAPDMAIYELHVRDFSINDATVAPRNRGKYAAFAEPDSNGVKHLRALSRAGITDVHLLPVFDIASVPEIGCVTPSPAGERDSAAQQQAVGASAATDCFNWGYDPLHFTAPEGSYASDAADGAVRIREFRQMVGALHAMNLRVGMDVVYNHTSASGQKKHSVLDRIVPGYYHRLNAVGQVETSTCCDNTATEHRMMAKLMIDSVVTWATQYRIDSFRFDLMGHQPRDVMLRLQRVVNAKAGRHIHLIGEGWNFGEVESGRRFTQASQLALNGTGIGTFSDRARDAVRGGGPADGGADLVSRQGYVNGLFYAPNVNIAANGIDDLAPKREKLLRTADMVRVGLAGSIRDYRLRTYLDQDKALSEIDYNGQPAGYVSQPGEVVNYVENHDNQTLYDINALKLPLETTSAERARVQVLALAINVLSQGTAYFHAGGEILRSKSLDRNGFDSGDWFNRLDWSYQTNYFGVGLPPKQDNERDWPVLKPVLGAPHIAPTPGDIVWTRDAFLDLLKIRASTSLLRLRSAADIRERLQFHNTGSTQIPTLLVASINGRGYPGARFNRIVYAINVNTQDVSLSVAALRGVPLALHPVHLAAGAADRRASAAAFDWRTGTLKVAARSAVVFVQ